MTELDDYPPLGRSGLRVSPLALGAMIFGTASFCADDGTAFGALDAPNATVRMVGWGSPGRSDSVCH